MNEKTESEEFDEDVDEVAAEADDQDLDRATRELEFARRRGTSKPGMPALRRLELLLEQKRTAELTSDFDDYDLDEPILASAQRVRFR
ncbi:MAG: hypothetical protein RL030_2628 [Pseudomonadota bacterium]|jgi:hypothetical protein